MSNRKPTYVIGLIVLAVVLSAPHALIGLKMGMQAWRNQGLPPLMGLGSAFFYGNAITYAPFWKDRFSFLEYDRTLSDGSLQWIARSSDPETGQVADLNVTLAGPINIRFLPTVFGDRLFFFDFSGTGPAFEVIDDVLKPSSVRRPVSWEPDGNCFIWNGDLALIEHSATAFTVAAFKAGSWQKAGEIALPESDLPATLNGAQKGFSTRWLIRSLNQKDRVHLFLNLDGRLYYREGIKLQPQSTAMNVDETQHDVSENNPEKPDLPARKSDSGTNLGDWSLVRSGNSPVDINGTPFHFDSQSFMGMFIDGRPAGLIVDDILSGNPIGHIYRFDGTNWTEFASQKFPFGTGLFRTVVRQDGQSSYLAVATSTGSSFLYAVDANGIRETQFRFDTGTPLASSHRVPLSISVTSATLGFSR
jgi:hypothetical protein